MGFDLSGKHAFFMLNNQTMWTFTMLAVGCGWEPAGTGPPRGSRAETWPGSYLSNDGQIVYARDARRLADVLERAASARRAAAVPFDPARIWRWQRSPIGRQDLRIYGHFQKIANALGASRPRKAKRGSRSRGWPGPFDRETRSLIVDYAEFCRRGSFRIY